MAPDRSRDRGEIRHLRGPQKIFSITQHSVDFIARQAKAGKPFYVQLSHYATHAQYQARKATLAQYEKNPVFAKITHHREKRNAQLGAAMAEDLDSSIGLVLAKLEELGIAQNTYVIFTADNGYRSWNEAYNPLRGAKWWLWDNGVCVPMIVRGPGIAGGTRSTVNIVGYEISVPASLNESGNNSPYIDRSAKERPGYRDAQNIQQMTSIYYGMVSEVDDWVGRILRRLDELGLAQNTLVIFTSDHGEQLGEHGLHGKFVFHEGSVHVPLLMRLPDIIPAGTVVPALTSHIDLFPTILDYLDRPGHKSEGRNLRPLIGGREKGEQRIAVSEWPSNAIPGFMLRAGRWKLLYGRSADANSLDALYDLQTHRFSGHIRRRG